MKKHAPIWLLIHCINLLTTTTAQQTGNPEKRGIAYIGTRNSADYNIFLGGQSPVTWYFNWSPYPANRPNTFGDIEFVPLLHNLGSLDDDLSQLRNLPSRSTHLLTFNEPDIGTDGGGSNISPSDAARAYVDQIAPLSIQNGGRWHISHPATTGTGSGLNWLRQFNESCFEFNPGKGCPIDFIATHFYGDFPALASWLGTLDQYYNGNASSGLGIWITEVALPQQSAAATLVMMNTTLPYLDQLDYVDKYSWFGFFREQNANSWTGDGVSLLDDSGDLTQLGARYLSTSNFTFTQGMSASDAQSAGNVVSGRESMLLLVGGLMLGII